MILSNQICLLECNIFCFCCQVFKDFVMENSKFAWGLFYVTVLNVDTVIGLFLTANSM